MFLYIILLSISSFSVVFSSENTNSGKNESIDGKYIMDHIQDNTTFEIFNPFDYNDSNNDHYYYTTKISLDQDWNKFKKISPLKKFVNWKWDPSKSLSAVPFPEQLILSKQSVMMFLASLIIVLLFVFGYRKDKKVQTGIGNLLEIFVVFIRDEVVYPNMGEKQGRRFLPLILTFFFFIVTLNLLGLIPGSSTATASFSVTVGLALITFFTYILFGNKDFWKHIFATPGVPLWLLPIMIPVEIIGLITKPFALSVRLLANMNAGHIIIMAFLGIIINMKSIGVALGSVPMAIAINLLEIFVAFLQAYIFSLLSSIFIGMAVVEHEHH
jgi:ATP synthase subunit 6